MLTLHPATLILVWCFWVIMVQKMPLLGLLCSLIFGFLLAGIFSGHKLWQLIWRSRWIIVSLLLVYGYSTPGKAIIEVLEMWSPTYQGLQEGLIQLGRILFALAGLALLLDKLHRTQLISGLYRLFTPLKFCNISPERLAIRLALTLHYAETMMLRPGKNWQTGLVELFDKPNIAQHELELPNQALHWQDIMLIVCHLILLVWIVL